MSAPDTNVERQEDTHRPSLLGIRGAMIFGALMFVGVLFFSSMQDDTPEGAIMGSDVQTDIYTPGTNVTN